ncbi:Shedu immune nuclease family protein [Roseibium algae]|uniref:Shedu immune nuclease family protein n=1 Tax=Roseibium algae TaxID=3123038 RepID=A0ABU8TKH7_9HYPH
MSEFSDDEIYRNSLPIKTYVSKAISSLDGDGKKIRIANKVIDGKESLAFAKVEDEIILRETPKQRVQIKATFIQDDRSFQTVTIQKFSGKGEPKQHFTFLPAEVGKLLKFLTDVRRIHFPDDNRINIQDSDLEELLLKPDQLRRIAADNQELLAAVARSEITTEDVVALAYRKEQLKVFERLLSDDTFFEKCREQKGLGPEGVWQRFLEKNVWILGYSLSLINFGPLEDRKLEQTVRGSDVLGPGKRVDALLRSRAALSTSAFVELKHHQTELVEKQTYRSGIWSPSKELSGAVAQVQGTVAAALERWSRSENITRQDGEPTGETLYTTEPRSFVICGRLTEFEQDHGVNEQKFGCFERFRRNLQRPEILTYDELYERACLIVQATDQGAD